MLGKIVVEEGLCRRGGQGLGGPDVPPAAPHFFLHERRLFEEGASVREYANLRAGLLPKEPHAGGLRAPWLVAPNTWPADAPGGTKTPGGPGLGA
eukprot:4582028-Lingulodinium_polyedra.AAC.1